MKKNKGISIYLMQVLFALIPLAVGAVLLTVVAVTQLRKKYGGERIRSSRDCSNRSCGLF